MKATGIVRKADNLGRIVIPRELCRTYGIDTGTPIEIFTADGGQIILRKYNPGVNTMADLRRIDERVREDLPQDKADKVHALIREIAEVLS